MKEIIICELCKNSIEIELSSEEKVIYCGKCGNEIEILTDDLENTFSSEHSNENQDYKRDLQDENDLTKNKILEENTVSYQTEFKKQRIRVNIAFVSIIAGIVKMSLHGKLNDPVSIILLILGFVLLIISGAKVYNLNSLRDVEKSTVEDKKIDYDILKRKGILLLLIGLAIFLGASLLFVVKTSISENLIPLAFILFIPGTIFSFKGLKRLNKYYNKS